jgi:oligopeptide/dipeptide ABC transporter ATP-binding protein
VTEVEALLAVEGLDVSYGPYGAEVHAVRGATFTLHKGEVLGVAGESGSGKSTLAFAITRLLRGSGRVTGGRIIWSGQGNKDVDLVTADEEVLRRIRWAGISIVFQSAMNALNPILPIGKQLDDVIRAHDLSSSRRERLERSRELLAMVGIPPERISAFPHELSGGMRQRAMIAVALALSPELVILDEPTTALDVVMQRQVLGEINRLRKELGFAIIFITHDLSLLIEVADQILVMYAGEVVERARSMDLYKTPLHPYSTGLLRSFPKLQGERVDLTGIPGSPPDPRQLPTGCPFHPRCPRAMAECVETHPALVRRLAAEVPQGREVACLLYDEAVPTLETTRVR